MTNTPKTQVTYLTIEGEYAGQRIDNFLITRFKNMPKTHVYRLLRKGEVRVNKKRVKPDYRLQAEDQIRIPPIKIEPENKPFASPSHLKERLKNRILFENKELLIINKPPGIAVHGGSVSPWGVIELFKEIYAHCPHLELAHRLDLDTSGCLILVKKRSLLREIHALLREGQVEKKYRALTWGHWASHQLKVDQPLQKNVLSSGQRLVKVTPDGKEAITLFKPLEKYKNCTLVEARLLTGRTHQIRVHAAFAKHPIAGDDRYGSREFNKMMAKQGLKRLFLHAYSIRFTIPSTQEVISVTAPLEEDLLHCLNMLTPIDSP